MNEEVKKYLDDLGFKYEESKELSSMSRKELVNKIISHPEAGKNFDRKSYKVEDDMKKKGVYYKC